MVEQPDRIVVAHKPEQNGVCYSDAGMDKSNAGYRQAEAGKGTSADKHLPGCEITYDAAHYPKLDDASIQKGGYKKTVDSTGNTVVTKGNDQWSYDENGKPTRHDHVVNGRDVADFPDGQVTTWDNGGLQVKNADGSYSEQNPTTKIGYTRDKAGNEHHWGPTDNDNYDTHKSSDGADVKVYAKDGRKEYNYPNGNKKYESADGKTGYTVEHHDTNSPFLPDREEKHWGKTAGETYTLLHYGLATVKEYADKHTEADYEGGQHVVHRGNQTVSTGGQPEQNYTRTEDPNTHAVTLKFADGRVFGKDDKGSYLVNKDGSHTAIGAMPDVRNS
jgi:hypothetical protein